MELKTTVYGLFQKILGKASSMLHLLRLKLKELMIIKTWNMFQTKTESSISSHALRRRTHQSLTRSSSQNFLRTKILISLLHGTGETSIIITGFHGPRTSISHNTVGLAGLNPQLLLLQIDLTSIDLKMLKRLILMLNQWLIAKRLALV